METRTPTQIENAAPRAGQILLLCGDSEITRLALYSVTRLATENRCDVSSRSSSNRRTASKSARDDASVFVVDGGNRFDAYFVAKLARQWGRAPEVILARVRVSRAFTCYQMSELIARATQTAREPAAIFCLNLLDTFCDEDVPIADAVRLFKRALMQLSELARRGSIVVMTARTVSIESKDRVVLWTLLRRAVDRVIERAGAEEQERKGETQLPLLLGFPASLPE